MANENPLPRILELLAENAVKLEHAYTELGCAYAVSTDSLTFRQARDTVYSLRRQREELRLVRDIVIKIHGE